MEKMEGLTQTESLESSRKSIALWEWLGISKEEPAMTLGISKEEPAMTWEAVNRNEGQRGESQKGKAASL